MELHLLRTLLCNKNSPNSTDIIDVPIVIQENRYILDGEEVSRENYIQ